LISQRSDISSQNALLRSYNTLLHHLHRRLRRVSHATFTTCTTSNGSRTTRANSRGDVDGRGAAVVAVLDEELDRLAVGQGAVAVGSDGTEVNKDVSGAVLGSYESETLVRVEPLNGAGGSPSAGHGS